MSIDEYNGSALVAMTGKNCVAVACDKRFGVQSKTLGTSSRKAWRVNSRTLVGLGGLRTDVSTVRELLRFRNNLYMLQEEREMGPETFANLLSTTLYEHRFGPYFISPVIAGLKGDDYTPYIAAMDLIGAMETSKDFVVGGTAAESLFGTCETFYKADLEPEELFETISQSLLAAVDRDALSGWGATVLLLTKDGLSIRELKMRQD